MGALALAGCGTHQTATAPHLPAYIRPIPVGVAPPYRIPPTSLAVSRRRSVEGLVCRRPSTVNAVHIELFAHRLVVPVPAGIGVAPPLKRAGAYVLGGACMYPVWTLAPTGVVRIGLPRGPTLGTLFSIWGQPLTPKRLASFPGSVLAFVDGRPWRGDPRAIPLKRHAEIVLEVDGYIPPHPKYTFPPGL